MKTKLMLVLIAMFAITVNAQVNTPCLTMEETNAQHNRAKANAIVVCNTYTQQMQCYYQQLATYWQQLHKDNQQKAKDAQQIAKDAQQKAKDCQQIETDKWLAHRAYCLNNTGTYDELDTFIQVILPWVGDCSEDLRKELKRIHTNRSGGGDGSNPGGGGNINGFDNPHKVIDKK